MSTTIVGTLDVPITRILDFRVVFSKHRHQIDDNGHLPFENTHRNTVPAYAYLVATTFYFSFFEMLSVAFTHSAIAFVVKKEENFPTYLVLRIMKFNFFLGKTHISGRPYLNQRAKDGLCNNLFT